MRSVPGIAMLILSLVIGIPMVNASESPSNPYAHIIAGDGTILFSLQERLGHPHFWWPRTLLNYRVIVTGPSAPPERWALTNGTSGGSVPVQISDITRDGDRILAATVSFFADLPSGENRSFLLHTGPSALTPAPSQGGTRADTQEGIVTIAAGNLQVRLPASQTIAPGQRVPGPIISVNDGHGWVGDSVIQSPKRAVEAITTEILDQGPLFARTRTTFSFSGGAKYIAVIKAPLDYGFVEFTETFRGLDVADGASFLLTWTGLPLSTRMGGEAIDKPHTLYFRGEDPHFTGAGKVEDPAQEFYFRLGHSAASSTILRTAADFSQPETGRSIGVCVLDGSRWDDGGYSIWSSSDDLSLRFRYRSARLEWELPLAGRTRQVAIAAYHESDPRIAGDLARFAAYDDSPSTIAAALANVGVAHSRSRIGLINSRYGGMGLDVVKEWDLTYPDDRRRSPRADDLEVPKRFNDRMASVDAYVKNLWGDNELMTVEGNWFSPVSLRQMHQWMVPGFLKFRDVMDAATRERATALLLFQGYLAAREEISPIHHMLKGHPNFLADWKYPLMAAAYFFPEHPMAREWADRFEKSVELSGIFHVRPEVKSWDAKGGRWTENIGVYNWAFLHPVVAANHLGVLFDGRERLASPGLAMHLDYLTDIVTSPVRLGTDGKPLEVTPGTALTPANGFQRIHPQQGAHSSRRHIPGVVLDLADAFERFAPLTADHLRWIDRRPPGSSTGGENDVGIPSRAPLSEGTNPRLRSVKYTGYGVVLRSAVDTKDEIAVFLQQIDKGPNYRWGFGNENGSGDIYYYAAGKSYSGHFNEDAGDRNVSDTELTCNTGVFKDATFRGIGMHDLTEPMYDLGTAQFAELLARPGPDAYSWPEYESRSVMLVGHDYVVIHDTVNNTSRVSWNTVKGQDCMPTILSLRGAVDYRTTFTSVDGHGRITEGQRLEPYKGGSDRMVLVSHRTDLKSIVNRSKEPFPVGQISSPGGIDYIYQQRQEFISEDGGRVFAGRAGVIRTAKNGPTEFALFHGSKIGNQTLQLLVDRPALGVSATFTAPTDVTGRFSSRTGGTLVVSIPGGLPEGAMATVNGRPATVVIRGSDHLGFTVPSGSGHWQFGTSPAIPAQTRILRSVAQLDGATIVFAQVPGANGYVIESSLDGGDSWSEVGHVTTAEFTLGGLVAPARTHLRVKAVLGDRTGPASGEHPVVVSGVPVLPPSGIHCRLGTGEAAITWGEVLGAGCYVLYRRPAGGSAWKEVHRGPERHHIDRAPGIVPAFPDPGQEAAAGRLPAQAQIIYEYAVAAADGIGEGPKSLPVNTDPASWRNWYPAVPLTFRRRSAYWLPPFVTLEQAPPESYPE